MIAIAAGALLESFFVVFGLFLAATVALSVANYVMLRKGMCVPGMPCYRRR